MLLAFDTETSGLFDFKKSITAPEQPRLLQLGAVIADMDGVERGSLRTLIRPDDWEVTQGALDVHGISTAQAARFGVPVVEALAMLMRWIDQTSTLVAHNLEYDTKIVDRELFLRNASVATWKRQRLRRCCTMQLGAAVAPDGRWPKLEALHTILIGHPHVKQHDGLEDARAALRCFVELRNRGVTGEAFPEAS